MCIQGGAEKIVYYIEYLLLENLVIDYLILYITKKLTSTKSSCIRLTISSLIGALYTIITVSNKLKFSSNISLKLCISILMIVIAFNPEKFKKFLKLYAAFYMVSFLFAGAALALLYLTDTEVYIIKGLFFIKGISIKILVFTILLSLLIIKITRSFIIVKFSKDKIIIHTKINLNGISVNIPALIDTGNSLKDPISESPVIVVEFDALKKLLPKEIQNIFTKYQENNLELISEIMFKAKDIIKFRVIPFKSLGKENGMLIGFKPDSVKIDTEFNDVSNIIVGIYNSSLSSSGEYKALLNPDIINVNKGEVNND